MTLLADHLRPRCHTLPLLFGYAFAVGALLASCNEMGADQSSDKRTFATSWNIAGLQIEQTVGSDWQALAYIPLKNSDDGSARGDQQAALAQNVEAILASHELAGGLLTLVAPNPCMAPAAASKCRERSKVLERVDAADQRPTTVACTSSHPDTCLRDTVRLISWANTEVGTKCANALDETCLYAIGFDKVGRLWIVCEAHTTESSLSIQRTVERSEACLSKYADYHLLGGVTI